MPELKYTPGPHDQKTFLDKAGARRGFMQAYDALALEYEVAKQMLRANSRTSTTPYDVAEHLRTPEEMAAYLDAWFEEAPEDSVGIAKALENVARAEGVIRAKDAD